MKDHRRFLAMLLCLLMCVSLVPAAAFAEETEEFFAEEFYEAEEYIQEEEFFEDISYAEESSFFEEEIPYEEVEQAAEEELPAEEFIPEIEEIVEAASVILPEAMTLDEANALAAVYAPETAGTTLFLAQPLEPVSGAIGDMITLSVSAVGEGLAYSWYFSQDEENFNALVLDCDAAELTIEVTEEVLDAQYFCIVSDGIGLVITDVATLTFVSDEVNPAETEEEVEVVEDATGEMVCTEAMMATATISELLEGAIYYPCSVTVVINFQGLQIRYEDDGSMAQLSQGTTITATNLIQRANGAYLYEFTYNSRKALLAAMAGTYITSTPKDIAAATITGTTDQTTVDGVARDITGTIKSSYYITKVTGAFYDSSSTAVQTKSVSLTRKKSLNLKDSAINSSLKYGDLVPGSYTLKISATVSNYYINADGSFTAKTRTDVVYTDAFKVRNVIKYNANGGSGAPSTQYKTSSAAVTLSSSVPTRTGYTFQGWGKSSSTTTVSYKPGASYSTNANITLYAVWKENTYTVTYNANGGTGAPDAQTKKYTTGLTLSDQTPTYEGYSFQGWATTLDATEAAYQPGGSFTTNANTTLYAVWEENTYTVDYNANGGTGAPDAQTKKYTTGLTLSVQTPTYEGYSFLGWATTADATEAEYQPGDVFTTNASTTLYAVWKINEPEIVITVQPADVSIDLNNKAVFTVEATGTNLTYQWQYSKDDGITWRTCTLTGNTTTTLSMKVTEERDNYQFRCVVTADGSTSLISDSATLFLKPQITVQPVDFYGSLDDTAKFTVQASGKATTYQWQYSKDGGVTWRICTLTGNATKTLSMKATAVRNNYLFRCVVTNGNGDSATSEAAALRIGPKIISQPENFYGKAGSKAIFTVAVEGANLSYQWQYSMDGGVTWKKTTVTGCTTEQLSVWATVARNNQLFRCVITDADGRTAVSEEASINVFAITQQPEDQNCFVGKKVKFSVLVLGQELTYQWQFSQDGGTTWQKTSVTGCKTSELSVYVSESRNNQQFRCVITDVNGTKLVSESALLTIKQ